MRSLTLLVFAFATVSCSPTASQVRLQQVHTTRDEVHRLPAPRQAKAYAQAIDVAVQAGDYKSNPQALAADTADAIAMIDRAVPSAGVDAPLLVAWRGVMFIDSNHARDGLSELERSFRMGPNAVAGRILIGVYGGLNQPQRVAATCSATVAVLRSADDKLAIIDLCRKNMNAASIQGELAWMSPDLAAWYRAEIARRHREQVDAENARNTREREQQRVVRQTEQCALACKETGLRCENDCDGNVACQNRCVEINHACVDRCGSRAHEALGD